MVRIRLSVRRIRETLGFAYQILDEGIIIQDMSQTSLLKE